MIEVMKLNISTLPYTNGMRYSVWLNSEVYYIPKDAFLELKQKINSIDNEPVVCEVFHREDICANLEQNSSPKSAEYVNTVSSHIATTTQQMNKELL